MPKGRGMKRRQFVGGLAATAGLAACAKQDDSAAVAAPKFSETFEWSVATSWPPKYPGLGIAVNNLADRIDRTSGGRLKIKVYAAGELVPAFEAFDAVSRGTIEMGHDAAYYHKGKVPAAQFMTAIPFGMTFMEMNGWLYYGGGLELWRELYEPFNLVPFPCGNTGVQMGGWFNKEINSIADLKGLKMRIPGLGGEVLRRAGGTPVNLPGGELFTSLQSGAIDATEWVGPYNDLAFGLYKAAKYYYYPGWHEPGTYLEYFFNKKAYDSLTTELKHIVDVACMENEHWVLTQFDANNGAALQTLINKHKVQLIKFPDEVLNALRPMAEEVREEEAAKSPMAKKVNESFKNFQKVVGTWGTVSEQAYYNIIQPKFPLAG